LGLSKVLFQQFWLSLGYKIYIQVRAGEIAIKFYHFLRS